MRDYDRRAAADPEDVATLATAMRQRAREGRETPRDIAMGLWWRWIEQSIYTGWEDRHCTLVIGADEERREVIERIDAIRCSVVFVDVSPGAGSMLRASATLTSIRRILMSGYDRQVMKLGMVAALLLGESAPWELPELESDCLQGFMVPVTWTSREMLGWARARLRDHANYAQAYGGCECADTEWGSDEGSEECDEAEMLQSLVSDAEWGERSGGRWFSHLSAPGYLDRTEWQGPYLTEAAAVRALREDGCQLHEDGCDACRDAEDEL